MVVIVQLLMMLAFSTVIREMMVPTRMVFTSIVDNGPAVPPPHVVQFEGAETP
jgi:hypothetical protein